MIQQQNWKWFGHAGHFICAEWCRFHLCTQVGEFLISTVGEYFPDESVRETLAKSRGIELVGRGDARRHDYMRKIGFEEIGFERKYETMVFKAGEPCTAPDCNCGLPSIDGTDLDFVGYNNAHDAAQGHLDVCLRWARQAEL